MGNGSIRNMSQTQLGAGEPLMGSPSQGAPVARARALYAYQASADDPNEISFAKGEMLDVLDQSGKWVCICFMSIGMAADDCISGRADEQTEVWE